MYDLYVSSGQFCVQQRPPNVLLVCKDGQLENNLPHPLPHTHKDSLLVINRVPLLEG